MTITFNPKTGEWEGTTGGVNLQELASRKPAKKVVPPKVEKKADQIEKQILEDPKYGYVKRLCWHIAQQYGLETKPTSFIFRNRKQSVYDPNSHQLIFGYESVDRVFTNGFCEYPTVVHVWWGHAKYERKLGRHQSFYKMQEAGKKSLWQLTLHEMAHFIDKAENRHGTGYQKILKELIVLFPYVEVQNV